MRRRVLLLLVKKVSIWGTRRAARISGFASGFEDCALNGTL